MRPARSQTVPIARPGSGTGTLTTPGTGYEMRVRDWRSPGAASVLSLRLGRQRETSESHYSPNVTGNQCGS